MADEIEHTCRERPPCMVADSGFYSNHNVEEMARRGIDAYVPDSNLARELNTGAAIRDGNHHGNRHPALVAMREKLRSGPGRALYRKRQGMVEPVFGILKEQRGMRRFRMRSLAKVSIEFTFAVLGYNLRRLHTLR